MSDHSISKDPYIRLNDETVVTTTSPTTLYRHPRVPVIKNTMCVWVAIPLHLAFTVSNVMKLDSEHYVSISRTS